jgi:sarcosine oxidase subunit delta
MKIMNCPLNGPRNVGEFVYGGEVREMPDPDRCSDAAWADHVFMQDHQAGEVTEWWLHAPTAFWFIARRDTRTDEIHETMTVREFMARRGQG